MSTQHAAFKSHWQDIVKAFLKLGAMSYGGPAIMGIMQAEKRFRCIHGCRDM